MTVQATHMILLARRNWSKLSRKPSCTTDANQTRRFSTPLKSQVQRNLPRNDFLLSRTTTFASPSLIVSGTTLSTFPLSCLVPSATTPITTVRIEHSHATWHPHSQSEVSRLTLMPTHLPRTINLSNFSTTI